MSKHIKWIIPLVLIAVAAAIWFVRREQPQPPPPIAESTPAPEPMSTVPTIEHPLEGQPETTTLPELDSSDEYVKAALQRLFGSESLTELLVPTQIVRNITATVDNLPRQKLAFRLRPVRATPGSFVTAGAEGSWLLDDKNYARYSTFMHLVQLADVEQVAQWYREYYKLFQQAYVGLGYPQGYFNDRLVQAIDDLLATPELSGTIPLVSPHVFFEFADPDLEARSAGQKTLLRMGPSNIKIIKEKLRQLRGEITKPKS